MEKIKEFLNLPVVYWIYRHALTILWIVLGFTSLFTIPKMATYLTMIATLEAIAIVFSNFSLTLYSQTRFKDSPIATAIIFLSVHVLVALSSYVVFSDII